MVQKTEDEKLIKEGFITIIAGPCAVESLGAIEHHS